MLRRVRSALIALAFVNLFVSTAYAQPSIDRLRSAQPQSLLAAGWEWILTRLESRFQITREEAGDSSNRFTTAGPTVIEQDGDAGSSMDPNGHK